MRLLTEEAERQRVAVDQLAGYAVMYYLGDLDSGRAARYMPQLPPSEAVHVSAEGALPEQGHVKR
jgi:hypothetical protein